MPKDPAWLATHARNVYSQGGEDGVIQKILETLPVRDRWCVEVGAMDGKYLSNTRNLIDAGYSSVQIEGDENEFHALRRRYANHLSVTTINGFVGLESHDCLDAILAKTPVPDDYDFLSIDVDGVDLHIWSTVSQYRPKLVCIEFNPTIPTELHFVQDATDDSARQGCSLRALVDLGHEKGYELVAVLLVNAFFVAAEYFPLFDITDNTASLVRKDLSLVTHIFSGYDGTVLIRGYGRLPWHHVPMRHSALQTLPKFMRRYPADYGLGQTLLLGLAILLVAPREFVQVLRERRRRRRLT